MKGKPHTLKAKQFEHLWELLFLPSSSQPMQRSKGQFRLRKQHSQLLASLPLAACITSWLYELYLCLNLIRLTYIREMLLINHSC